MQEYIEALSYITEEFNELSYSELEAHGEFDLRHAFNETDSFSDEFVLKDLETDIDYQYLETIKDSFVELMKYTYKNFIKNKAKYGKTVQESWKNFTLVASSLKKACQICGLQPSQDQYIFSLCDYPAIHCQAVPGAGKTTFMQIRAVRLKIEDYLLRDKTINDGTSILNVVYNTEACEDMAERHKEFIYTLNRYYVEEIKQVNKQRRAENRKLPASAQKKMLEYIEYNSFIQTMTFHKFALYICDSYGGEHPELKIPKKNLNSNYQDIRILSNDQCRQLMEKCLERAIRDDAEVLGKITESQKEKLVTLLIGLNGIRIEMLDFELERCDRITNYVECKKAIGHDNTLTALNYYQKIKTNKGKMDFSDFLLYCWQLLQCPDVVADVRGRFKTLLFDEYQDSSDLMTDCLILLSIGRESLGIPLSEDMQVIVVADCDQSLYRFRGINTTNCLTFNDRFGKDNAITVSMQYVRRCLSPIVDAAASMIKNNKLRVLKPIVSARDVSLLEGDIGKPFEECKYKAIEGRVGVSDYKQALDILKDLKNMTPQERGKTAILYRNKASSILLMQVLYNERIPAKITKGLEPFKDTLSRLILDMLSLMCKPTNQELILKVFPKILPRERGVKLSTYETVCYQEMRILDKDRDAMPKAYWQIPFSNISCSENLEMSIVSTIKGFKEVAAKLNSGFTMKELIKDIFNLIDLSILPKSFAPPDAAIALIQEAFNKDVPYKEFIKPFLDDLSSYQEKCEGTYAVHMTTYHSSKGKEWDTVYLIDLSDNDLPGKELKECNGNPKLELEAHESARRLLFVAMTRAKNKEVLYIPCENPSRYLKEIDKRFFSEEVNLLLDDALFDNSTQIESEVEVIKESQVNNVDTIADSGYLNALPLGRLVYDNQEIVGYYDGFLHLDYYYYKEVEEQRKREEVELERKFAEAELMNKTVKATSFFDDSYDEDDEEEDE